IPGSSARRSSAPRARRAGCAVSWTSCTSIPAASVTSRPTRAAPGGREAAGRARPLEKPEERPVLDAPARTAAVTDGLSTAEATRRLARDGPNEVASERRFWALRALLGFAGSPLVLILLVASVVSALVGQVLDAALIALMIVLSVGLDFVQLYRSEQ